MLKIDRHSDRLSRRISGAGSIFSVENHAAAITARSKGSSGKLSGSVCDRATLPFPYRCQHLEKLPRRWPHSRTTTLLRLRQRTRPLPGRYGHPARQRHCPRHQTQRQKTSTGSIAAGAGRTSSIRASSSPPINRSSTAPGRNSSSRSKWQKASDCRARFGLQVAPKAFGAGATVSLWLDHTVIL